MSKIMRKKFYVIGNPINKSLSPLIFNYWFDVYKMDCHYERKLIQKNNFEESVIKIIRSNNFFGLNITAPFKNKLSKIVDQETKHAKSIGAINCIYKENKKTIGTNTDWQGYLKSLKYQSKNTKKNNASIIGFGGAAKAIIYALEKFGFNQISIFVRNPKKLESFLRKKKNISGFDIKNINKNAKKIDLLVNSTTTSRLKDLKIDINLLNKNCVVSDINYFPHETELIKNSTEKKLKTVYGIYMLLFQAAPAFKHWFGFAPKVSQELIEKCKSEATK